MMSFEEILDDSAIPNLEMDQDGYWLSFYTSRVIGGTVKMANYHLSMWTEISRYCEEVVEGTHGHRPAWQISELWLKGPNEDRIVIKQWIVE